MTKHFEDETKDLEFRIEALESHLSQQGLDIGSKLNRNGLFGEEKDKALNEYQEIEGELSNLYASLGQTCYLEFWNFEKDMATRIQIAKKARDSFKKAAELTPNLLGGAILRGRAEYMDDRVEGRNTPGF